MRGLTTVAGALLVAVAVAQIPSGGIRVPASGPMPNYFSGTYCRADGYYGIESPPPGFTGDLFVAWAELTINGISVAEYEKLPEQPGLIDIQLGVIFDSTFFGNGTNVTVKLCAMDSAERVYIIEDYAEVRNSAIAWNHPETTDGASNASLGFSLAGIPAD